jgi:GNAT superfamily N-acetyltransferase
MHFRPATSAEAVLLGELALRSKAHWGYDQDFLEACRAELTIDSSEITASRIVVADFMGRVVGFYSLLGAPPVGELGHFFVEPSWIGKGVGRSLWCHMSNAASTLGFNRIRIESDPGAAPFYETMGAQRIGIVQSGSVEGRQLPLLIYSIPTTRVSA